MASPSSPFLTLEGVGKRFGEVQVLEDLSLAVGRGEVLALLGLSGSGKTTALRLIAGFETPDAGRIVVDGQNVAGQAPAARGFGMVFQHYALFPHMTVAENVAFGLESRGVDRVERAARVDEMLALVDLAGYGDRRIDAISGGQQQRVALARALAPSPRVLLLDEPLSNLDPALRERTRRELRAAIEQVGITTVLVTHEQEEAFDVGDRVAVLHQGRLEQLADPRTLYRRPASRFVATFVGRASALEAVVTRVESARVAVRVGSGDDAPVWWTEAEARLNPGDTVDVVVRPETLTLTASEAGTPGLPGVVAAVRFTGASTYVAVDVVGTENEIEVLLAEDDAWPTVGHAVAVTPRDSWVPPRAYPRQGGRG